MTTYALPEQRFDETGTDVPAAVSGLASAVFARPYLRLPQLATLRAYDRARGAGYLDTLAACLDSLGNAADSAARLGVHVNTFRYRLRRLVAVSGLDLDDPDERLVCALELAAPPAPVVVRDGDAVAPQWCGLSATEPLTVVAFRVLANDDEAKCRLARMVALSWDAFRTSAWCDVTGSTVYSVVSLGSTGSLDVVACTVRRVVREAERTLGLPVVAGIGPAVDGSRHAEASRRLADDVLAATVRRGGDPVATLDELRTAVVLAAFRAAAAEWPDLDNGVVARLAKHDEAHGTEYVASLRAYLDCFGDVSEAARRTYVHVRTFRYRLRRIAEIGEMCLDDAPARLAAHLTLRLS